MTELTSGSIKRMQDNILVQNANPRLQLLQVKEIANQTPATYRAVVSDGKNYTITLTSENVSQKIKNLELEKLDLFTLKGFSKESIQGKQLTIIQEVTNIQKFTEQIGQPTKIEEQNSAGQNLTVQNKQQSQIHKSSSITNHQPSNIGRAGVTQLRPAQSTEQITNEIEIQINTINPSTTFKWQIVGKVVSRTITKSGQNGKGE